MKNYYELLGVDRTASADDIKHAFRQQIARYHPDKVQHLGTEFQAMADDRAAELTAAYRILSSAVRRAEYDSLLASREPVPPAGPPRTPKAPGAAPFSPAPEPEPPERAAGRPGEAFSAERASRDTFIRKAALLRFRHVLEAVLGGAFDEPAVGGFDAAIVPKGSLFARAKGPRLLVRFVPSVDADAVADAWTAAARWAAAGQDEVCVILMGSAVAPARDLARAIGEQRRKGRAAKITLIPVDARDWQSHIPTDTPQLARTLLERLQKH